MNSENVSESRWIEVGKNRMPAYVLHKYNEEWVSAGYYQNGIKVIKDDFVFLNGVWEFKNNPPAGTYIKNKSLEIKIKSGPYSKS